MNEIAQTPRDFNYIKPRKRRLSEYEAVSCYTQPDPKVFDRQGWYLLTAEGRTACGPNRPACIIRISSISAILQAYGNATM